MIKKQLFLFQGTPINATTDENGTAEIPVGEEGATIVVTFTPSDPNEPISVGPIEVKACAEPGMYLLVICINQN